MLIAVPVGVGVALFITQYAPALAAPARRRRLVDLLAAVPSIVYGLWGADVFGHVLQPGAGRASATVLGWIPLFATTPASAAGTIFFIGIVLAIMVLPIVTALSREVFAQTPATHKEGALALGATRWEMIRTAVLPFGRPGVISASMLGLGRALGETIAVAIILSTLARRHGVVVVAVQRRRDLRLARSPTTPASSTRPQKTGAFIAAGLVLFVLTFVVNAIARSRHRAQEGLHRMTTTDSSARRRARRATASPAPGPSPPASRALRDQVARVVMWAGVPRSR